MTLTVVTVAGNTGSLTASMKMAGKQGPAFEERIAAVPVAGPEVVSPLNPAGPLRHRCRVRGRDVHRPS